VGKLKKKLGGPKLKKKISDKILILIFWGGKPHALRVAPPLPTAPTNFLILPLDLARKSF
jgi:hypothetical protein